MFHPTARRERNSYCNQKNSIQVTNIAHRKGAFMIGCMDRSKLIRRHMSVAFILACVLLVAELRKLVCALRK
jgi:hypothetical protein